MARVAFDPCFCTITHRGKEKLYLLFIGLLLPLAKSKFEVLVILLVFLFFVSAAFADTPVCPWGSDCARSISQEIRCKFETQLSELKPYRRAHWDLRIQRHFKDASKSGALVEEYKRMESRLDRLGDDFSAFELMEKYGAKMEKYGANLDSERKINRFVSAKKYPDYFVFRTIVNPLGRMNQIQRPSENYQKKFKDHIESIGIEKFFSDTDMVRAWTAPLANLVYYIYDLWGWDFRSLYLETLWKAFPNEKDNSLSDLDFQNKIYGLTHMIIGASGYYQRPVSKSESQEILQYFAENIDLIIRRSKVDVLLEVGLSFLLSGENNLVVLNKLTDSLVPSFDKDRRMFLSVTGDDDLNQGEHRNILAVMFFDWAPEAGNERIQICEF